MRASERNIKILQHVVKYCQEITTTKEHFHATEELLTASFLIQNAICMPLLQIGELVNHLSADFKAEHPEIPWHAIVGMRNFFAHEYEHKDMSDVWKTVVNDVPILERTCIAILKEKNELIPTIEPVFKN